MRGTRRLAGMGADIASSSIFGSGFHEQNDTFNSPFGGHDIFNSPFVPAAERHGSGRRAVKAQAIERKLPCSLEELYKGTTKKIKVSREIISTSNRTTSLEEILTIDVKPGWKKGTKITFPERGNAAPNIIPADLVFIIDEKPHPVFTRDGNDLVLTQKVPLAEALTGYAVHLTTLDGRSLTVPISSIIHPRYEEVVRGEGMPIPKNPSRKGSLRIKFDIEFPAMLTSNQKSWVKSMLGLQREMKKDGGHGANMALDSHTPTRAVAASTHGEDSRPGRVIYIGSVPVRVDSI